MLRWHRDPRSRGRAVGKEEASWTRAIHGLADHRVIVKFVEQLMRNVSLTNVFNGHAALHGRGVGLEGPDTSVTCFAVPHLVMV